MYSKILVASDGSDNSLRAAQTAGEMAKGWKSEVTLICVAYVPGMYQADLGSELVDAFIEDWKRALTTTERLLQRAGVKFRTKLVREGKPAEMICQEAEAGGYDLLVLGGKGRDESPHPGLGSVSDRVVHAVHCSVLVVK